LGEIWPSACSELTCHVAKDAKRRVADRSLPASLVIGTALILID
jgi:hypothetical protein